MRGFTFDYIMVLVATFLLALIATPLVRFLAFRVGAVDNPNARRINKVPMPSSGGLAIVFAFSIATMILMPLVVGQNPWHLPYFDYMLPVVGAGMLVAATGFVDDIYELKAWAKMIGLLAAAVLVWVFTDFRFDSFKFPFGGPFIEFNTFFSFVVTVIWIVGITNAVNFLDGLDGLVSGVSIISLLTMGVISAFFLFDRDIYLTLTIFVLIAAIMGFFPYNYHPAIIYLGDTGALFIGFMISVLSLQGLKNATAVAVLSPMIVLGVPIMDTFVAIVRRQLSGQKFYEPDRLHLHHKLLTLGFTHRGAVLVVYGIALLFSLTALLFNLSSRWGGLLLMVGVLLTVEIFIEGLDFWGEDRTPLFNALRFLGNSDYRQAALLRFQERKRK